ncbi:HET-domain-containing protein [Apiospora marii]|uniref:HET-domain-containing protein n=1 Tax=Apiospora marii TaxID=335849 RepID=UPI00312F2AD5
MTKPKRCAPELQDLAIWNRYEPQLRDLYLSKNQTLKQVKQSMEEQHGWPVFKLATYEVVLRDELRLVKYLRKDDCHAIQHHIEKRKLDSKRSEVVLHGRAVDQRRITKAIKRYRRSIDINRANSPILRDGLRIRTPPLLSPHTFVPGGMTYTQMAAMVDPSCNITNQDSPILPESRNTTSPVVRGGPLSERVLLDIRTNAPFNQFAEKLQELRQSFITPMKGCASSVIRSQHLVMDSVPSRRLLQLGPSIAKQQVLDTSDGSSNINMGQLTGFFFADEYFGVLLKACYVLSNNLEDLETQRPFLEWVGLVAEMDLLRAFFSLKLPTVIAVWENSLDASYRLQHGKAFAILIEIGLAVDDGRLIRSRHAMYFALAVDLGSSHAMGSVSRLMKAGVSPNSRFDRSCLSLTPEKGIYGDELDHYWRCCALKQAAKNRDPEMLELLLTAGSCRCGKFDAMYGNVLLCMVATRDPTTGRPPSLQCVNVITDAGMRVDFLPEAPETVEFTTKSLGWHNCGKPELLLDRVFFSDVGAKRDIYETLTSKSQWAQNAVTVSGIFLAAEVGPEQIKRYLESAAIPQSTAKEALLQIALSEAADREDIPVLTCLLRFGIDPNVNALMAGLSDEEERLLWSPVVRASTRWNNEALRILLVHGVDVRRYSLFRGVMQKSVTPGSNYSHLEKRRSLTIQSLLDVGAPIDVPAASLTLAALVPLRPHYPGGGSVFINDHIRGWLAHIESFEPDYALCDKLQQHGICFDRGVDHCNTLQTVLREGCNRSTVSYLIYSGVPVHSFRSEAFDTQLGDTTMLHDALLMAHVDRLEIVDLLLKNGANICATTSKGMSILEASLRMPNLNIPYHMQRTKENQQASMDIFRKLFGRMEAKDFSRVEFKRQSFFSYLVELEESDDSICARLDAVGGISSCGVVAGLSPLMHAIMHHRTTLLMKLVERGCDVNLRIDSLPPQQQGNPPQFNNALQIACYYERGNAEGFSIVQYLLGKGAKANEPPATCGVTALQSAAFGGNLRAVTMLLEHGADVNATPGAHFCWVLSSSEKVTNRHQAVDMAASVGHLDMVHLLVEAGGLSGNPGMTGLDGAITAADRNGFTSIVEYLERHTGHQLSDIIYRAKRVPATWTSSDASTSSAGSERTDGERSCHCQPAAIDRETDGTGEEGYSPVEDIPDVHGAATTSRNLSMPLRFPVYTCTFTSPDSPRPETLHKQIVAPGAATIAVPDAKYSSQAGIPNPWNLDLFKFPSQPSDDCLFNLARVRYWLDSCTSIHSRCGYYGDTVLPTRVLDVGPGTDSSIFLRESKGLCGRYICLSYCWGNSTFTKTTRDNIESHKQGIILESLPQTFQDTIHVARALNVRFLWIDALCIIQQDVDCADWKRECGNMANIYRNAYLTISATWANSPTLGLFPKPNWFRLEPIVVRVIHHLPKTSTPEESVHFPVLGRGWTYQERMLATRVLHFGPSEMIWDCMSTHACECATADDEYYNASKSIFSQAMSNPTDTGPHSLHTVWRRMVEQYTPLQLTSPTDRLSAFSGLANEMQQGKKDLEYLAGLWRDTLVSDMCWAVAMPEDQKPSPQAPRRLPTWSWTSVDAPVQYYEHIRTGSPRTQLAEVLDARCILEGPSATGPVKEGFIELECSLIPAFFEDGLLRTASFDFKRADFDAAYGDQPSGEYYVIPLCLEEQIPDFYPDPDPMICGIIVTQKNSQEMTRVGAFKQHSKELIGFEKQKVRIV